MTSRSLVLVMSTLLFLSPAAIAQNGKQELNDQFWEAVRKGDSATVTALLDKGADVNAKFRYGTTALFKAAERGHVEVVKILLARGADVTVKDTFYGQTAMSWAIQNDHADVVNAILDKQPSSANEVFMAGVSNAKPSFVQIALDKGTVSKEAMTRALAITKLDKDYAPIAEMLKKAGAIPPPEIKPETLQSYAGTYKGQDGPEITIRFGDGILVGNVGIPRPQPLYAIDEVTFSPMFVDDISARFRVEGGKVTGLTLTQGKKTTEYARAN